MTDIVYVVGDIHGRADCLKVLHDMIVADAAKRQAEKPTIVYLGDYVDRGPDSREVVEIVRSDEPKGFDKVALKGNHEDLMLMALTSEGHYAGLWLNNGGLETLKSYGVDVNLPVPYLMVEGRKHIPMAHIDFLGNLPVSYMWGRYLCVHAGVRPNVDLDKQSEQDMLWIRKPFLESSKDFGKIIIHGHTPNHAVVVRQNRIGIDTMAFLTDNLTAAVLDGNEVSFLSTNPAS